MPVYVELPQTEPSAGWLAAADELAAAELRLKFRTGGVEAQLFPTAPTVAAWIDAALDRETPFKCTAGLHNAVRHRDPETGFEHHGFLNVLIATAPPSTAPPATTWSRSSTSRTPTGCSSGCGRTQPRPARRRWFTSFGSCRVTDPLERLVATGLLEDV